jgi:cob(I)alamin adenosyltransferase
LVKIYTKTGDAGYTGLFAGPRVPKDHGRIEAYGTVDELNAALGLVRTASIPREIDQYLGKIQNDLFAVGAELATPDPVTHGTRWIGQEHVEELEKGIDVFDSTLPKLTQFILPTGCEAASRTHLARAICRRAERHLVTLCRTPGESISEHLIVYLNRLGDLLFVLSRALNAAAGTTEQTWQKEPCTQKTP